MKVNVSFITAYHLTKTAKPPTKQLGHQIPFVVPTDK